MKTLFVLCGALLAVAASAQVQFNTFSDLAYNGSLNAPAAAGYTASATTFAGDGQCWMERDGALTGASDGNAGTFSVWVKFAGGNDTYQGIFVSGPGARLDLIRWNNNTVRMYLLATTGTEVVRLVSTGTLTADGNWHHIICAWDRTVDNKGYLYIDGSDVTSIEVFLSTGEDANPIDYTEADYGVGAYVDGGNYLNGCLSELWFNTEFVDITVQGNREKFRSAGAKPVSLGADGSTPTGNQPLVYFKGEYSGFTVNSGSGGNFVKKGTTDFTTCTAP